MIAAVSGSRDLAVDYPHADFDARIGERPIDDPRLTGVWGSRIYRITLAARQPAAQGALYLKISLA